MTGPEPSCLTPITDPYDIRITHMLNWYNHYHDAQSARKYIPEYMKAKGYSKEDITKFNASNHPISRTHCALARMACRCAAIPTLYEDRVRAHIRDAIAVRHQVKAAPTNVIKFRVNKKLDELIARVEDELDRFFNNGYQSVHFILYEHLRAANVSQANATLLRMHYKPLLEELLSVTHKTEGFDHLTKKQLTNYIAFVHGLIEDCDKFCQVVKAVAAPRKPRKKKVKAPIVLLKNFKYQSEDKGLKIASINPLQIFEANSLWIYNTKYRKLTKLVADKGKQLSVNGTTIINISMEESSCKTLRKPEIDIPRLLSGGKIILRKFMSELTTKPQPISGRSNEETILLRADRT